MNGYMSPYWTLDAQSIAIFLHPTLRELRLSCVNILDGVTSGIVDTHFTPLRNLTLDECNITHGGLHEILSLPKGVEVLYLGLLISSKLADLSNQTGGFR